MDFAFLVLNSSSNFVMALMRVPGVPGGVRLRRDGRCEDDLSAAAAAAEAEAEAEAAVEAGAGPGAGTLEPADADRA